MLKVNEFITPVPVNKTKHLL